MSATFTCTTLLCPWPTHCSANHPTVLPQPPPASTVLLQQILKTAILENMHEKLLERYSNSAFWHDVSFAFQKRDVGPLCVSSLKPRVLGANYQEHFEK